MAATEFIDQAARVLEESVLEAKSILEMCDQCAGDNTPDWLFIMRKKIMAIDDAAQDVMAQFHQHARPLLRDLERATSR